MSLFCWLSLLLLLGCGEEGQEPTGSIEPEGAVLDSAQVVVLADISLETAVREALQKPSGSLSEEDLRSLTTLSAQSRGIESLQGIERLADLTILDLADNHIQDVSALATLTQLTFLDLSQNQIKDISPLAALSRLESLVLEANQVRDLAPLLGLRRLRSLEASGNPLAPTTSAAQLAALEAGGVKVVYRAYEDLPPPPTPLKEYDLVFVGRSGALHQDIYRVRTDGSDPVNLARQPAKYSNAARTRDGSRLVFLSDRDGYMTEYLCAMDADGSDPACLFLWGRGPEWSPDGSRLAFVSGGPRQADGRRYLQVFTANADGSNAANLLDHPDWDVDSPRWSPEGNRIALVKYTGTWPDLVTKGLYLVNADGSGLIQLTEDPQVTDTDPAWSPDGQRIAFTRCLARLPWDADTPPPPDYPGPECDICVADVASSTVVRLTDWPGQEHMPVWSPDGRRIAFLTDRTGLSDLCTIDADGSNLVDLAQGQATAGIKVDWTPGGVSMAWSPEGTRIALFASQRDGPADLCVIGADGGSLANLTNQQPRVADCWVAWISE